MSDEKSKKENPQKNTTCEEFLTCFNRTISKKAREPIQKNVAPKAKSDNKKSN